jgi:hypothetical protein
MGLRQEQVTAGRGSTPRRKSHASRVLGSQTRATVDLRLALPWLGSCCSSLGFVTREAWNFLRRASLSPGITLVSRFAGQALIPS